MTRIVAISDTHGMYDQIVVPEGDILIHAGDILWKGEMRELAHFNQWLSTQSHPHKVIIAGNHDWVFERRNYAARQAITNAVYLQDDFVTILGLKIWGSPWQPRFFNWAFNLDRGAPLKKVWDKIPNDTDVLVTHGPPFGRLDRTPEGLRVGCEELAEAVARVQPKLHIFGHIHLGYGIIQDPHTQTIYANASVCTERYQPSNPPLVIDL